MKRVLFALIAFMVIALWAPPTFANDVDVGQTSELVINIDPEIFPVASLTVDEFIIWYQRLPYYEVPFGQIYNYKSQVQEVTYPLKYPPYSYCGYINNYIGFYHNIDPASYYQTSVKFD